jgi:hypothetical protein
MPIRNSPALPRLFSAFIAWPSRSHLCAVSRSRSPAAAASPYR